MTDEWKKETELMLKKNLSREQILQRLNEYKCEKCGAPAKKISLFMFGGRLRYVFDCSCGFSYVFNSPSHDRLYESLQTPTGDKKH